MFIETLQYTDIVHRHVILLNIVGQPQGDVQNLKKNAKLVDRHLDDVFVVWHNEILYVPPPDDCSIDQHDDKHKNDF